MSKDPAADGRWTRGLWLHERQVLAAGDHGPMPTERVQRTVEQWAARVFNGRQDLFERRLAESGLDARRLAALLAFDFPCDLAAAPEWWLRARRWAQVCDKEPGSLEPVAPERVVGGTLTPLIANHLEGMRVALEATSASLLVDASSVVSRAAEEITDAVGALALPAFVLELHASRVRGRLRGPDENARFNDFVSGLKRGGWQEHFEEYVCLPRAIDELLAQCQASILSCVEHFVLDYPELIAKGLLSPADGRLSIVHAAAGDPHRRGKATRACETESGAKVVYKPRSLRADIWFQQVLEWLNREGARPEFPMVRMAPLGNRGWQEYISHERCETDEEVHRFFRRQGGFLAVLLALNVTDVHFDNLIACGECPYLIDLETALQPRVKGVRKPFSDTSSVLLLGMLPSSQASDYGRHSDGDLSALGATADSVIERRVSKNPGTDTMSIDLVAGRLGPTRHSPCADPIAALNACTEDLLDGFRDTYRRLARGRSALADRDGELRPPSDLTIRTIVRATAFYQHIVDNTKHPIALTDAATIEAIVDDLWLAVEQSGSLHRMIPSERRDLLARNIPIFTGRTDSVSLWDSEEVEIANALEATPRERFEATLASMSDRAMTRETWLIDAALCTYAEGPHSYPPPRPLLPAVPSPDLTEQLVRRAADRLLELGIGADGTPCGWYTLDGSAKGQRLIIRPADVDYYSGASGIGTFLAYAGSACGEPRYTAMAQWVTDSILEHINRSLPLGHGIGLSGVGGVIYALVHLGFVLRREDALETATSLATRKVDDLVVDTDVMSGWAGWIKCLLPLVRATNSQAVADALDHAAASLLEWHSVSARGPAPLLTGYAHGAAGIADSLASMYMLSGAPACLAAAQDLVAYERRLFDPSVANWPDLRVDDGTARFMIAWCHGAPGVALSRMTMYDATGDREFLKEMEVAISTTLRHGFGSNHSLCHGDSGNLEILRAALDYTEQDVDTAAIAASVAKAVDELGFRPGIATPRPCEMPGLMKGIAGSGFALLRGLNPTLPCLLRFDSPAISADAGD